MKLIAFDIEACNRYVPGSIFSIGIVEARDNFEITDKYNILINPETKFVTKFRKPIDFNIDVKSLKSEPNFKTIYPKLVNLFSDDALYVAHSISNDIRMLNYACKRYSLKPINFNFICSQMVYSVFSDTEDGIGLNVAGQIVNSDFVHHKADDDAMIALKLIEYICANQNLSFYQMLDKYKINYGRTENYSVSLMSSDVLNTQRVLRKQLRAIKKQDATNVQDELTTSD